MQSYLKIMLWIYSLKISHCHSFSDKRHRKARGSGYRVNGKGGTMTQWGGGNLPSGGSFPLYAGLFTSCKEKKRDNYGNIHTYYKKIKHTMQFIHFIYNSVFWHAYIHQISYQTVSAIACLSKLISLPYFYAFNKDRCPWDHSAFVSVLCKRPVCFACLCQFLLSQTVHA